MTEPTHRLDCLRQAACAGALARVASLTAAEIAEGTTPEAILERSLLPALQVAVALWVDGQVCLPELHMTGRAVARALTVMNVQLSVQQRTALSDYLRRGLGSIPGAEPDLDDLARIVADRLPVRG
jgi:methanogenic corrinoid protein MtbC1